MNNIVPDGYLCPLCGLPFYGGCKHSAVDIMIDAAEKIDAQSAEIERLQAALDEIATMKNVGDNWLDVVLVMKCIARAAREKREVEDG